METRSHQVIESLSMKRNWLIGTLIVGAIIGLYYIELSKFDTAGDASMPDLDNLTIDEVARGWDAFYRVRATIIDGQSASLSIPEELRNKEGKQITLSGAAMFYGNGCKADGNQVVISWFLLVPSLGIAQSCEISPDISMRYTVRINLEKPWILERDDMINAMVKIDGLFHIDTSKPYEAVFYVNDTRAELII